MVEFIYNTRLYSFVCKVVYESDINWKIQNQIHYLLNTCFRGSKSFISKTYSTRLPMARTLIFHNSVLVGHMGLCSNQLYFKDRYIDVGCMGLWCVGNIREPDIRLNVTLQTLRISLDFLSNQGYTLATGLCNKKVLSEKIIPDINAAVLHVPIIGGEAKLKDNESFILFNCNAEEVFFKDVSQYIINSSLVKLKDDVF